MHFNVEQLRRKDGSGAERNGQFCIGANLHLNFRSVEHSFWNFDQSDSNWVERVIWKFYGRQSYGDKWRDKVGFPHGYDELLGKCRWRRWGDGSMQRQGNSYSKLRNRYYAGIA